MADLDLVVTLVAVLGAAMSVSASRPHRRIERRYR